MNRGSAIAHIQGLSRQVASEFCVGADEEDELAQETRQALLALGCTELEAS